MGKQDFFTIKGFMQSAFAEIINPDGRVKVEIPTGSSGLTDTELRAAHLDVQQVSGSVSSVFVTGSSGTVVATGPTVADAPDDGNAPVQMGGVARTTNPAAVADNDIVKASFDKLGRALTAPIQVRGLVVTAYASVTNITETTLIAGVASTFLDLIYVKFSNQSSAAVNVEVRGSTGGTVVDVLSVPANSTVGYAPPRPIPQSGELGSAWTFKNAASDDSTTTIVASGLFSKEI